MSIDEVTVSYALPSIDSYVVALYHLDEGSGAFVDSSGRNNTLIPVGTPTYNQSGYMNTSTLFDTNGGDYGRIADAAQSGLDGMEQFTFDAWVKRVAVSTVADSVIVKKWDALAQYSFSFQMTQFGALRLYVSSDGTAYTLLTTPNNSIALNEWSHVAAVYDGSHIRIFVNGIQRGNAVAFTGTIFNSTSFFTLSYPGSGALNGYLDEVRISNVARWTKNFTPYTAAYGTNVEFGNTVASITPNSSFANQAVSQWYSFSESAQKNSGTITYQLSADNGASWQYWNGTAWVSATVQTQANDAQTISNHIWAYPVATKQIRFRAFLTKDAVLGSVSVDCSTLQMEAGDMMISGSGNALTLVLLTTNVADFIIILQR